MHKEVINHELDFGATQATEVCKTPAFLLQNPSVLELRTFGLIDKVNFELLNFYEGRGLDASRFADLNDEKRRISGFEYSEDCIIPNRAVIELDLRFAEYFQVAKQDPSVKSFLDQDRKKFEERYSQWYGQIQLYPGETSCIKKGVRDTVIDEYKKTYGSDRTDQNGEANKLDLHLLKARRAFLFPPR